MGSPAQRKVAFVAGLGFSLFLTFVIFHSLAQLRTTLEPEIYLQRISFTLIAFTAPLVTTWRRFKWPGVNVFTLLFLIPLVLFIVTFTKVPAFFWIFFAYGVLMFVLYRTESYFDNLVSAAQIEEEKYQDEINNLEVVFRAKGEGISTFFEKYSTYYNLRKLAEELTLTLDWVALAQKSVDRAMDFIPRGDHAKITLAQSEEKKLPVVARRRMRPVGSWVAKQGDLFDFWCIKNRKRLIVMDTHEDFRFALRETEKKENVRSMIVAPLFHEGRVSGTLAIHATRPDVFSHDDLRLLDAIATLASSAISNAMLYEKTERLAIKDSLTGLYVRRYFYERLKEEHRRCLLNKKTMSLIMCDLDHFKECNDRFGHQGLSGAGVHDFSHMGVADIFSMFEDIFGAFGGGGRRGARRGADLQAEVAVTLHDVAVGVEKTLEYSREDLCDECGGTGAAPGSELRNCGTCGGYGQVEQAGGLGGLFGRVVTTCPTCHPRSTVLRNGSPKSSS